MANYDSAYTGAQIDDGIRRAGTYDFGWQNFQDTATATTPINLVSANTWYDLTNNAAGPLTSTAYKVPGHGAIWNSTNNTLDFSSLAVGDVIRFRFDVLVTSGGANQNFFARLAFGPSFGFSNVFSRTAFKSATTDGQIFRYVSFAMLTSDTQSNPAKFQMQSDAAGNTVKVNGWLIETQVFVS